MLLVNLFGSPSSGKSTGAAYIYSKLKVLDINAELVTEVAKDLVWEENHVALSNQIYVLGEQCLRISRVSNKVDVVVTDAPLLLGLFYNKNLHIQDELEMLVKKLHNQYNNINYFVKRVKTYNPAGRLQTEEESDKIKIDMLTFLNKEKIKFDTIEGNIDGYNTVIRTVLNQLSYLK